MVVVVVTAAGGAMRVRPLLLRLARHHASRRVSSSCVLQHEGPLLSLLERRYAADKIYTFTGDILISINPYKHIRGLYDIPE